MDLPEFIGVMKRSWVLVCLIALAGVLVGVVAGVVRTPLYTAQAQLYVSVRASGTLGDLVQGSTYARQAVVSYTQVVTSPSVLGVVAESPEVPYTAAELNGKVTADSPSSTSLINIRVLDPDPEVAALIANQTAAAFIDVVANELEPAGPDGVSPVAIHVIGPATPPGAPSGLGPLRTGAIGLMMGLVFGVAIAVLRSKVDTRVRSEEDVRTASGKPLLGTIAFDRNAVASPLIAEADPDSMLLEHYRALRTSLSYVNPGGPLKSFVITSSGPGVGKTLTACNLAWVTARASARVLLLDSDLRHPRVSKTMHIPRTPGLSDVLAGRIEPRDAIQNWGGSGLSIMPAGHTPPNPSELLGSRTMRDLMAYLEANYDLVMVDSPPVDLFTDATLLAKLTEGAVVLAAYKNTKAHGLAKAVELIEAVDGNVFGVVLTCAPDAGSEYYGSYYGGRPVRTATDSSGRRAHRSSAAKR
ncbi:MAG: polysaccharide biosynthesis tyrosine autokinase [Bifidobacteriaceae bacterium]|jgi:capsular exopolysaccharide synthesis family protein|nr:polysaccharide biosynthesis tyrosine autokinase [Bifidobacteriaceae bacterium]